MEIYRYFITQCLAFLFVILMFNVNSYAGTCWDGGSSGASPWFVLNSDDGDPSCGYADVNYCINTAALGGDTVYVPPGDCTWNTTLTISTSVFMMGAGTTDTVIRRGGSGTLIRFNPSDYSANDPFRLSGFYFDLNGGSGFHVGVSTKRAPFTMQTKFRVDNNVFDEMGSTFRNAGAAWGVVDNNTFNYIGSGYPFKSDPQVPDQYNWWVESPQKDYELGSEKNLYFEDNIINVNSGILAGECQYGGRYAFRNNTITTYTDSYSFFEMHGHQTSGDMPSCFGAEIYGNDIISNNKTLTLFKTRGGSSMVFGNSGSNVSGWSVVAYLSLTTCPDADPDGQMVHDTYQWMNRVDYTGRLASTSATGDLDCGSYTGRHEPGRDLVGDSTTPGVTYGTLADIPGTCIEHQGYWVTTQDLTDLTDYVGVNPTTPLSGTLFKCDNSNNWIPFYTPLTYPHPLRSNSINDTNVPGPPLNLQVNE